MMGRIRKWDVRWRKHRVCRTQAKCTRRLIDVPVLRTAIKEKITSMLKERRNNGRAIVLFTVKKLQLHLNITYKKELAEMQARTGGRKSKREGLSYDRTRRWLFDLGFHVDRRSGLFYNDGHEREDVVQHRERYIKELGELLPRLVKLSGDKVYAILARDPGFISTEDQAVLGCTLKVVDGVQETPVVMLFHDESSFQASGHHFRQIWAPIGGRPEGMREKRGPFIMVTGWLSLCHGLYFHELFDIKEAKHYWRSEDMVRHCERYVQPQNRFLPSSLFGRGRWRGLSDVLILGELLISEASCVVAVHLCGRLVKKVKAELKAAHVVFVLDNSSGHSAYASDALIAANMNVGVGGFRKGAPMKFRDGRWENKVFQ